METTLAEIGPGFRESAAAVSCRTSYNVSTAGVGAGSVTFTLVVCTLSVITKNIFSSVFSGQVQQVYI